MANLGKKWGTALACWAVALAFVVMSICLGIVIPSSAAADAVIVVTCGESTKSFTNSDIGGIGDYLEKLPMNATAEKPVVIKLLKDIYADQAVSIIASTNDSYDRYQQFILLDLAGHVFQSKTTIGFGCVVAGSLTIIDSNPTATHYAVRSNNSGTISYEFFDSKSALPSGAAEQAFAIKGGVVTAEEGVLFNSFYGGHDLVINGGNFLGTGIMQVVGNEISEEEARGFMEQFGFVPSQRIIINGGLMELYVNASNDEFVGTFLSELQLEGNYGALIMDGSLEINGGTIYGKIAYVNMESETVYDNVDLSEPNDEIKDHIIVNVAMKKDVVDGVTVYYSDDAEAPANPNEPVTDADTAHDNNNLIALIVLGAAAAVMVVGVSVIVAINAKRRKKAA